MTYTDTQVRLAGEVVHTTTFRDNAPNDAARREADRCLEWLAMDAARLNLTAADVAAIGS